MKKLGLAATMGFLLAGGLAAGPVYQVSFTGTMTSGTASGFNPAISGNSLTQFADLTGLRVSGSLYFDFGQAPAPVVSVDAGGFITTSIQSSGLPVFTKEDLTIEGFSVPAGFFPMPTEFNQPAVSAAPPGSTLSIQQQLQSISTNTKASPSAQSVLGGLNFQTSWSGPRFNGGSLTSLDILASSFNPFFPVPPTGNFPDHWAAAVPGQNGIFNFSILAGDSTIPANFGITQWYDVNGNFELDSASGRFLTPEPGTLATGAMALLLVAGLGRRKARRCRS